MRVLIFGLGYSARIFAQYLEQNGHTVLSTARNPMGSQLFFDKNHPLDAEIFQGVDAILSSIPPQAEGDVVLAKHTGHMIQQSQRLKWVGYLSTIGVYGDYQGQWISEGDQERPSSLRTLQRYQVEQQWMRLQKIHQVPTHIFRLGGIYGPGRSLFDKLKTGDHSCIEKEGHVFNRIYVDDIAQTLLASLCQPSPGNIYNVVDDCPASLCEVTHYAASLMNIASVKNIPYEGASLSTMMQEFFQDNRRVKNNKIKNDLGVTLHAPTYREGLAKILWNH